jgi:hypothetical protein
MDQWVVCICIEEMPKIERLRNPILVHNLVKIIAKKTQTLECKLSGELCKFNEH